MFSLNRVLGFAGIAALLATAPAFATPAPPTNTPNPTTSSQQITATVLNNCLLATSNTLAFGNYDPIVTNNTTALPGQTTFTVSCTKGDGYALSISLGANAADASHGVTRSMKGSANGNYLAYDLYETSGLSTVWNTTNTETFTSAGMAAKTYTIYGNIPAGQDISADAYSDTVTISAAF